ncbi:MAG: hypothetical protein R3268_06910 [Acidiferrobacterales bacterium]|nr:hypothetical protein [Acidiferrobacterales bacterium]
MRIAQACPIDPEGVGPIPGDVGQIVAMPESDDVLRCLRVHFERIQASWSIPRRYLRARINIRLIPHALGSR